MTSFVSVVQVMNTGQQLPQSPIDALHTVLDGRNAGLLSALQARIENLQFISHEGIHVPNYAQPLGKFATVFALVKEDNKSGGKCQRQIVHEHPGAVKQQNEIEYVPSDKKKAERQSGEEEAMT